MPWGSAHFLPERLDQPSKIRKPGRVFVCSMSDIGHETVKPEWREAIFNRMARKDYRHHQYIILTKRPGPWMRDIPQGVLCGVTIENKTAKWRLSTLYQHVSTASMFVSVEPMLEPVSFQGEMPSWVIAGPETGPRARHFEPAWIDALECECFENGVPFFDKRKMTGVRREWPK